MNSLFLDICDEKPYLGGIGVTGRQLSALYVKKNTVSKQQKQNTHGPHLENTVSVLVKTMRSCETVGPFHFFLFYGNHLVNWINSTILKKSDLLKIF